MKRDVCPVLQSDWTAEILREWYKPEEVGHDAVLHNHHAHF